MTKVITYESGYHNSVTSRPHAVADLAEDVGNALLRFANQLRAELETTAADDSQERSPDVSGVGKGQRRILEAIREAGSNGLTTGEVAEKAEIAKTNAPRALKALRERGLITGGDETPAVWREAGLEGRAQQR